MHPDKLVFALLGNGFEEKCYDGQPFFSASHKVGKKTVSNKGTAKLTMASYIAARAAIMSLTNSKGEPLGLIPDTLVVPPALESAARDILIADQINGTKNTMLLLEDLTINDTYLNTTPQEMIAHFLSLAGITDVSLSSQVYPERKRVPICGLSGVKAIDAVNAAWGLKNKFFFSGGTFYWGTAPKQEKVYAFEYGINILSLERSGGVWIIETVSAPFVKHSHKIAVTHPKVNGTFEVSKVVFSTNDAGFIRTYIYFS